MTGEGFAIRFSPNPSSIPVGCDSGPQSPPLVKGANDSDTRQGGSGPGARWKLRPCGLHVI